MPNEVIPLKPHKYQVDHPIEFAFNSGGNSYYCFSNPKSLYYQRWCAIQDRFEELNQRVTKDYLHIHCQLVEEACNQGLLSTVAALNFNLQQRLSYTGNLEHLYLISSVWFFDQDENPYVYDVEHGYKKIEIWMKDKEVLDFFFKTDIVKFLPSTPGSEMNSKTYIQAETLKATLEETQTLELVSRRLFKGNVSDDTMKSLTKRLENLKRLRHSIT